MTQDPDGFQWHASRSLGPAGIGAALQAAGAEVTDDPASGAIDVCVNGRHLARVGTSAVAWHDATVAKFVRLVLLYHRMALALRQDRNGGTFTLRGRLRERLDLDPLLASASAAGVRVKQRGGITSKDYFLSHPAFGDVARLLVLRGQSYVAAVTFADRDLFDALESLVEFEGSLAWSPSRD
jgi:hypothetical protein